MARIDLKNKVIQAKLVYYGPGLCGKTTNLEYINKHLAKGQELMSLSTEGDRTIFFDFMPLNLGKLRGMDVQFKLYTVPGQVRYNETRKMVLKNVDCVVFVADSQELMMDANLESLDNLYGNLKELGIDPESTAIVLQYNKRDLPSALPREALDKALNKRRFPTFLASAMTGEGVGETLKEACTQTLNRLVAQLPGNGARNDTPPSGKNKAQERPAAPAPASAAGTGLAAAAAEPTAGAKSPDLQESISALLSDSARVQAFLKEHLAILRELGTAPKADQGRAELMEKLVTRADLSALGKQLENIASMLKVSVRSQDLERFDKKLQELSSGTAKLAELQTGLSELSQSVKQLPKPGSAAVPGDLATKAHIDTLEQRVFTEVVKLRTEVTALGRTALAQGEGGPTSASLDKLPSKADVAAIEKRLADLPTRSDLDKLRDSSARVLGEVTKLEERLLRELSNSRVKESTLLEKRLADLPTRSQFDALLSKLDGLATRDELEELRAVIEVGGGFARPASLPARPVIPAGEADASHSEVPPAAASDEASAAPERARPRSRAPRVATERSWPPHKPAAASEPVAATPATMDTAAERQKKTRPSRRPTSQMMAVTPEPSTPAKEARPSRRPTALPPTHLVQELLSKDKDAGEKTRPENEPPVRDAAASARPEAKPADAATAAAETGEVTATDAAPPATDAAAPPKTEATDAAPPATDAAAPAKTEATDADPAKAGATSTPPAVTEVSEAAPAKSEANGAASPAAEVAEPPAAQASDASVETQAADTTGADASPPAPAEPEASGPAAASPEPAPAAAPATPATPATATSDALANDPQHVNASRVARVMVADLYLYNKEAVEEGIKNDDFFERNKEALADMRTTYESRVPEEVRATADHFDRAVRDFIAKKKKQWGLE